MENSNTGKVFEEKVHVLHITRYAFIRRELTEFRVHSTATELLSRVKAI